MKHFCRILLSFALMTLLLASCAEKADDTESALPAENPEAAAETVAEEEEPKVWDTVTETFAGHDYDGAEIHILGPDPGQHFYKKINGDANEVWYEEQTGDIYTDAVCQRNTAAEDLLNIVIAPVWGGGSDAINGYIQRGVQSGDSGVDFAVDPLVYGINLGVESYVYNLLDIDTLSLDSPWWDANIVNNFSYRNRILFSVAGHYNVFDDYAVPVIFYNKKVITDNGLEAPNELVRSGEWTLEKMMTSAETATADLNGDGKMSEADDAFGYLDNGGAAYHLMSGLGEVATYLDEEGIPRPACQTESFINAAEMIFNQVVCSPATIQTSNATDVKLISENRGLFYYELLGAINEFRDMEEDFSLLPLPKRNEEQESYSALNNPIWCTSLVVPVTCPDFSRVGVVMDVLSGYSTDTVNRTLYELILGSKLVRDEETTVMLDYVLHSKVYDWGEGFTWFSSISSAFSGLNSNSTFTLASSLEKVMKAANKGLERTFTKMEEQLGG